MIFQADSIFSRFMSKLGDFIVLNLLFVVTCIPVFTIGTSCCALYRSIQRCILQDHPYAVREYWKAWKENFKQATLLWILYLIAAFVLAAFTRYFVFHMDHFVLIVIYLICFLLFTFTLIYIFPLQATFINSPFALIKNSLLFSLQKLPLTLMLFIATFIPAVITWKLPQYFYITILYWLFAGFSLCALFSVIITKKVFHPYLTN